VLASCVRIGVGEPLTEIPKGVEWCGAGPERNIVTTPNAPGTAELFPSRMFAPCTKIMWDEAYELNDAPWRGSLVFGVDTDATGQVSGVCVYGGNYGNAVRYLECVRDKMLTSGMVLPHNLKRLRYTVTFENL